MKDEIKLRIREGKNYIMDYEAEKLGYGIWISKFAKFAGLNNKVICYLLESSGGLEKFCTQNPKTTLELIAGPPEKVSKAASFLKDSSVKVDVFNDAKKHSLNGIRLIAWTDDNYPEKLRTISAPPSVLYINGNNAKHVLEQKYSVAIVGTRNPTPYGEAVTAKFVKELSEKKIVIVSGMARGIDSLAHLTALDNDGLTIAVLGCGLDIVYPPENKDLMRKIIDKGLLMSECPPQTPPLKSTFPARNRIISGLSDAVAVMEASKKSGTMITAGYAGEQGRDLFAVPGSIFSPNCTGTNQLIQDGACVLTNIEDMLWKIPLQSIQTYIQPSIEEYANVTQKTICKAKKIQTSELNGYNNSNKSYGSKDKKDIADRNDDKSSIYKILMHTEKTSDEISQKLGINSAKTSEILSFMELSGEIIFRNGRFSLTDSYKYSIN